MEQDGFRRQGTKWVYNQHLCRPTVSIIIVTYNSIQDVSKCIKTIQMSTSLHYEIIVVDNHSSDDTQYMLKKKYSYVTSIYNDNNLGFSLGINQAIARSKCESWLKSSRVRFRGSLHTRIVTWAWKLPSPFPNSKDREFAAILLVTRSVNPSWLKSPERIDVGFFSTS